MKNWITALSFQGSSQNLVNSASSQKYVHMLSNPVGT